MAKINNLHVIADNDIESIIETIQRMKIRCLHATNGAYGAPRHVVEGTTVTGFKYLDDHVADPADAFLIAVNSDKSMANAGKADSERQNTRAMKVLEPVAAQFPDRRVIGCFYDEETPTERYKAFSETVGLTTASLHKWGGFGIGDNAPVIEGAEYFDRALAFPFYNADKPAFWNDTRKGNQSDIVEVVDLHRTDLNNGKPYLDPKNKPLFDLK